MLLRHSTGDGFPNLNHSGGRLTRFLAVDYFFRDRINGGKVENGIIRFLPMRYLYRSGRKPIRGLLS